MEDFTKEGVKTFFLLPNTTLMPRENFLKTLFYMGFEVYYILEDRITDVAKQVSSLVGLFEEVIVFINISKKIPGVDWQRTIEKIANTHQNIRIGVLHQETDDSKKSFLEKFYLMDVGITSGCLLLKDYNTNLQNITALLTANKANGRRKAIRMICHTRFYFRMNDNDYSGTMLDISMSYFSCVFAGKDPNFEIGTKIPNVSIVFGGGVQNVNTVVGLKRASNQKGTFVYVFAFYKKGKLESGLDLDDLKPILETIYSHYHDTVFEIIKDAFRAKRITSTAVK